VNLICRYQWEYIHKWLRRSCEQL